MQVAGYTDITPLSSGASGDLFSARQIETDRPVALKVFRVKLPDDRTERRYLRDMDQAKALADRPHIVPVYDAGLTDDRSPYLAMQLVEGGSIDDWMAAEGTLGVRETLHIGIVVADALAEGHEAGLLHRFLQPTGILINATGDVLVAELGVPLVAERWEAATDRDGFTPHHTSPEVLERTAATPASDVYSLASTLYTMLAGRPPYWAEGADSVSALLLRVLQQEVPPLPRDDVPPELATALRSALAADPARRTATAEAFGRELREVQALVTGDDLPTSEDDDGQASAPLTPPGVFYRPAPDGRAAGAPPAAAAFDAEPPSDVDVDVDVDDDLADHDGDGDPVRARRTGQALVTGPLAEDDDRRRRRQAWLVLGGGVAVSLALLATGLRMRGDEPTTRVQSDEAAATQPAGAAGTEDDDPGEVVTEDSDDGEADEADGDPAVDEDDDGDDGDEERPRAALRVPTGLTTHVSAAGVLLEWDETDTDRFAVLVLSEDEAPRVATVSDGPSLLIPALDLRPDDGYCFAVARMDMVSGLADGTAGGDDVDQEQIESAFGRPACIRGAAADTIRTD